MEVVVDGLISNENGTPSISDASTTEPEPLGANMLLQALHFAVLGRVNPSSGTPVNSKGGGATTLSCRAKQKHWRIVHSEHLGLKGPFSYHYEAHRSVLGRSPATYQYTPRC